MTTNRFKLICIVASAWSLTMISQVAGASQSKAQLYLPWPMLNTKLNKVLSQANSSFSTNVPNSTINADGILWSLTNISYVATSPLLTSNISSTEVALNSNSSHLKVDIEKLSVDQIIQKDVGGVIVNVHLKADCGPITFAQPNAKVASVFSIDWTSGSPTAVLQSSDLAWAPNSWIISPFTCVGPEGLNDVLRSQIAERLKNADDFKPYLNGFLVNKSRELVDLLLEKIRVPFTVQPGSTTQIFQVGSLFNLPQGVVADLTVSDVKNAPLLPALPLPSAGTLKLLSTSSPSLLAGKDLLEQVIRDELNTQASSYNSDLQNNPSFHALMHDRLKQVLGWVDLIHYDDDSSFPLTLFKPQFQGLTVLNNGNLQTTVNMNGVVQSYREGRWWRWLVIGGNTSADVTVNISAGKISYSTALVPVTTSINYSDEYKKAFGKEQDAAPPAQKIIDALSGQQPALSGSFIFPKINIGDYATYQLSGIKWLTPNNFVLSFREI